MPRGTASARHRMTDPQRTPETASVYSPPPEPRPTWSHEAWQAAAQTPARWLEPLPGSGAETEAPHPRGHTRGPLALVVATALIAGAVGWGGTLAALYATGSLATRRSGTSGDGGAGPQRTVEVTQASAVTRAAAAVSPAVVTITTQSTPGPLSPFQVPTTGVGSGVIYNAGGFIITNHHVVEGATGGQVSVQLADGRQLAGRVYGTDTLTDLAIVKVDATHLPTAPMGDSNALQPGQVAVAIGSPLGTFTNSVTSGIISALGRTITVTDEQTGQPVVIRNLIQTDAAINPGNSGGALVDVSGDVVGINTAVAQSAEGIGFAIPIDIARPIMRQAVAGEPLARPWIGVYFTSLSLANYRQLGQPINYGAYVNPPEPGQAAVVPGSPAAKAGLQSGDIITAVNGQRIDDAHPLDDVIVSYAPGDTIDLQVLRAGQSIAVKLTLGTRPSGN